MGIVLCKSPACSGEFANTQLLANCWCFFAIVGEYNNPLKNLRVADSLVPKSLES